ncbi:hypothetical protein LCGC14_1012570 [marine sediment metagenome]|uniref:Uncharacterized protein n=1 Tax=marine sediment metagenome TaxID=412755 RepID=A0A0F9NLA9_9ZZZZ
MAAKPKAAKNKSRKSAKKKGADQCQCLTCDFWNRQDGAPYDEQPGLKEYCKVKAPDAIKDARWTVTKSTDSCDKHSDNPREQDE